MMLKTYADLYALLQQDRSTNETCRAFGLKHPSSRFSPLAQLHAWVESHRKYLQSPTIGERLESYLYYVTLVLLAAAFVLGIITGVGLLSYNGHEPVNVIYFLFMAVTLPLFTMLLALFSMISANRSKNTLVHISPAYWVERLVALFGKNAAALDEIRIDPRVLNWLVIKRSQMAALTFSVGLFVALIAVVATHDVAFAWSTTLQIDAQTFEHFLRTLALPWRSWMPSAVPTLELVEQSQYYRLGGSISPQMIDHAAALGAWWKFLAMATLCYAVLLRIPFYLMASWGLKKAIAKGMLSLEGAKLLLECMNEPLISTHSEHQEGTLPTRSSDYPRSVENITGVYESIEGWSLPKEVLSVICDTLGVEAPICVEVGGNNTLEMDQEIASKASGKVLLIVKAWEPPTMDFMDYLQLLASSAEKIVVVPVGTTEEGYVAQIRHKEVWVRKLAQADMQKVWIAA